MYIVPPPPQYSQSMHYEFVSQGKPSHLTVSVGISVVKTNQKWNAGDEFLQHKTHLLILLCLCMNFWVKTKWPSFHTSLPTRHSTVWLISFPRTQDGIKEKENKWDHHDCSKIIGYTWWDSNSALHKMVQMVVWSLVQPNKVPSRTVKGETLIGRQVLLLLWGNTFSPQNIWVHHIYLLSILHC